MQNDETADEFYNDEICKISCFHFSYLFQIFSNWSQMTNYQSKFHDTDTYHYNGIILSNMF